MECARSANVGGRGEGCAQLGGRRRERALARERAREKDEAERPVYVSEGERERETGDRLKETEIEGNFTLVLEADQSGSNEVEKDRLATVCYVVLGA